ncbi:conserved hypothetical protein [Parvibaculum lavamentivorans DS-1]|uniref:YARHG domain-containing protein n=1 Tax=Parvibaculum lavamentivorans (strain DS-1 / DSM 13023 / NCIMB 13966) TaxID=402881 RepID=A7HWJ7_PARL1|nr:hypothetical protein [Parvibaculum lavamentivorans]ABS64280.1 conserved hypothetical protein [Parvibaculum lavamentivorans DS-1]
MMLSTKWRGAMFALGLACAFGPARADVPEPATATMTPVASGGEVLSPELYQTPEGFRWRITKTAWTESDERAFGEFVTAIGESNCRTFDECLKGPWNIYRTSDPKGMFFYADCADLPYALRAYFAWKTGLPFSYTSGVAAVGQSRDLRYSRYGNYVYKRTDVVPSVEGAFPNGRSVLNAINNVVSTAMYRFAPSPSRGDLFDFYPVKIAKGSIRPGTVIYDPNGHVAVVYSVDEEGRIRFIDAHPDNSLTRGSYGKRFVRASAPMGAGFKNWRPMKLAGARQGADGTWYGGRVVLAADHEIADWSDEQFYGNGSPAAKQWASAIFIHDGQRLDYYDYVRQAVAGGNVTYDPIMETRLMVRELCDDLHYRAQSVDVAVMAGLHRQAQPARLPDNIYGTTGDWETYSTPSRDARLKTSFVELRELVERFIGMAEKGDPKLDYEGGSLAKDLKAAYAEEAGACEVAYTASDGSSRRMSFEEARARVFGFSFDPYHCPELRWGARSADELATCPDGETKRAWYDAQQRLRNQIDRTYDVRMGFTLADLRRGASGSGADAAPDTDVMAALRRHVAEGQGNGLRAASSEP